eukprot:m.68405 g.68405  ORF g.68405 m.68405 type:complete len:240 (+) comp8507_c0_seq1:81-800(+)
MSNASLDVGKTPNGGVKDSTDTFPLVPSTLAADLAAAGFAVRPFEPADVDRCRDMFQDAMTQYIRNFPEESPLRAAVIDYIDTALSTDMKDADTILSTYKGSGGQFWVVSPLSNPKKLVAQVGLQKIQTGDIEIGELRRMYVSSDLKRSGLGSKLVRVVEEYCAENGFHRLVLTTGSFMQAAMDFYIRNGFEVCRFGHPGGELKAKLAAAGESFCEVAYRKPITGNNGRWMWVPHATAN